MKTKFLIDHIDSLAQGVSKIGDKVTFISKTLPGEEGEATIFKSKKGVCFAYIDSFEVIKNKSNLRISPECSHYYNCNSCNYLHTNYQSEINFKESTLKWGLERLLNKHNVEVRPDVFIHSANKRMGYRNRVQLHYDLDEKKIGYINTIKDEIIPVPKCKIGLDVISKKIEELYENDLWIDLVTKVSKKEKGHIELYSKDINHVEVNVNQRYASGGFSQVNKEMNDKMIEIMLEKYKELSVDVSSPYILDLFGGDGNISRGMSKGNSLVVDSYKRDPKNMLPHQDFLSLNLYSKNAVSMLSNKIDSDKSVDLMIIDPPRSGMKNLNEFLKMVSPNHFFYVSCSFSTMLRDIDSILETYNMKEVHMIDFFPGTYHFETFMIFEKKLV